MNIARFGGLFLARSIGARAHDDQSDTGTVSNPAQYDLTEQEEQQQAAERREQLASEQRIADWKWMLSNKRGRRIVWALLEESGVYKCSFIGSANATFFNEGIRSVGLKVLAQVMAAAPDRYIEMMQEHKE